MSNNINETRQRRLIPVTQWSEHHPWPPKGGLRWLIFHRRQNGFERCVRRVGRRLLIDEAEFFRWVDEQQDKGCGGAV